MSLALPLVVRPATRADVPALNTLIAASARVLSVGFYTPEQIDAAGTYVFGVDTGLIDDGTYYVVETEGQMVGCGGWSRRGALYGGDQRPMELAARMDPAIEPARIRAFFVAPGWARRGIGGRLLEECRSAAEAEGFSSFELMGHSPRRAAIRTVWLPRGRARH